MLTEEKVFINVAQYIHRDDAGVVLPARRTVEIRIVPDGMLYTVETINTSFSNEVAPTPSP
jgi:hypothetical protein